MVRKAISYQRPAIIKALGFEAVVVYHGVGVLGGDEMIGEVRESWRRVYDTSPQEEADG